MARSAPVRQRLDPVAVGIVVAAFALAAGVILLSRPRAHADNPLFQAIMARDIRTVQQLARSSANLNARRKADRATPLIVAVNSDEAIARALLDSGADVNAADIDGETPLLKVMDALQQNLSQGSFSLITRVTPDPARYLSLVRLLIERGANVNAVNNSGVTPLIRAVQTRREDVVGVLLQARADPNQNTGAGEAYSRIEGGNALCYAAEYGLVGVLKLLVQAGGHVDIRNGKGATPLTVAARWGRVDCVRYLLQQGADPNARTLSGETPLMFAVCADPNTQNACVCALLEHGARVNDVNAEGETPLILAAQYGTLETVRALLERGASVNQARFGKMKPVAFSIGRRVSDLSDRSERSIPASAGARPAVLNGSLYFSFAGDTALAYAAMFNRTGVIQILLEHGARVNTANERGQTPLHVAAIHGAVDAARLLVKHGARTDLRTRSGETAWQIARRAGDTQLIAVLERPRVHRAIPVRPVRRE